MYDVVQVPRTAFFFENYFCDIFDLFNRTFRFLIFLVASSEDQVDFRCWQIHIHRPRSLVLYQVRKSAALLEFLQSDHRVRHDER